MASKKILLEFDIDNKDVKIAGEETMNLVQKTRILRKELQKTREGTVEFEILRKKIGDTEDQFARVNVKSRDFFGVLSTLPGPVGQFGSSVSQVVETLKVFSSFKFTDIKNSFTDIIDDVGDVVNNFFGLNKATKDVTDITKQATSENKSFTNALTDATTQTAANRSAIEEQTRTIEKAIGSKNQYNAATDKMSSAAQNAADAGQKSGQAIANMTAAERIAVNEKRKLAVASEVAAGATLEQAGATEALTISQRAAAVAGKALRLVLASLGIGLLIAGVAYLLQLFGEWISSTEKADAANKSLNETIKEQEMLLSLNLKAIDAATKANITRAKIAGKSEQEILEIQKQAGRDRLAELRRNDDEIYKLLQETTKNRVLTEEQRNEQLEKIREKYRKSGQDIIDQINANEQIELDGQLSIITAKRQKAQQKQQDDTKQALKKLKDLRDENFSIQLKDERDKALAQLRVEKENEDIAIADLKIKAELRGKLLNEVKERYRLKAIETNKKFDDLEAKAFLAFLQKTEDTRIAAIADAQQREEEARATKLYFDKIAYTQDTEFQKKSIEEQNEIFKNLEIAFQEDIQKIRDEYYIKDKERRREEFLLAADNQTKIKENELAANQIRLQQQQDFSTVWLTNLKETYNENFVGLRDAYQKEYDEVNTQLTAQRTQLQQDLDSKKISKEAYASQLKEIDAKIQENNQEQFDRNRQLDQLEIDAKRANADALLQIGSNLVGLLGEIGKKSRAMQKAAAITEALVSIARIVIDTQRAIIAFSASVAPLGPAGVPIAAAYALKSKIAAGIAIATIIASGINKINDINESDTGQGGEQAKPSGPNYGRNYAQGGMIGGRRHAQGGTMIEAEAGEAIMTRGAVTMFGPLLSMMNQAGGGTSFNQNLMTSSPDRPKVENPAVDQSPAIIKTYVVEGELTTAQQRQARLKDLSTL
jgi:hypothetical protein